MINKLDIPVKQVGDIFYHNECNDLVEGVDQLNVDLTERDFQNVINNAYSTKITLGMDNHTYGTQNTSYPIPIESSTAYNDFGIESLEIVKNVTFYALTSGSIEIFSILEREDTKQRVVTPKEIFNVTTGWNTLTPTRIHFIGSGYYLAFQSLGSTNVIGVDSSTLNPLAKWEYGYKYQESQMTIIAVIKTCLFSYELVDSGITLDTEPEEGSSNGVTSGGVFNAIQQAITGAILSKGSLYFEDLENLTGQQNGWMYNIRNDFETDDTFKEGPGLKYPAGTNVVWLEEESIGLWDIYSGDSQNTNERLVDVEEVVFPFTVSLTGGNQVLEKGTTSQITLYISTKRKGEEITPEVLTLNGNPVTPINTKSLLVSPLEDTLYSLSATYQGMTKTSTNQVYFVYPTYQGLVDNDFVINQVNIQLLENKLIKRAGATVVPNLNFSDNRDVIAYPSSYGALTSIKDQNGFEQISGYITSTLTLSLNGTNVGYRVYLKNEVASNQNITLTYK